MPLSPTRSSRPPETPVLIYDGNCPFCTAMARWIERRSRTPLQLLEFSEVEGTGLLTRLTEDEVESAAHFVTTRGIEYHGGQAVTRALRLVRFGGLAAVLDAPVFSLLRDGGYWVVEKSRPLLSKFIHP